MTDLNLNKGRFKWSDDAQAAWNFFVQVYSTYVVAEFKKGDHIAQLCLSKIAHKLHKAHLIHGSIYDDYGRIEDKDVAHAIAAEVCKLGCVNGEHNCNPFIRPAAMGLRARGEIRGTIFY